MTYHDIINMAITFTQKAPQRSRWDGPFLDAKSSIKIAGSGRCQGCLLLATWRLCWQFLSRKSLMSLWWGWQIPNYATSCKKWIKPRNTTQRDPPFGWKRPRFQGDTPKKKSQLGSSYVKRDKEKKRERKRSVWWIAGHIADVGEYLFFGEICNLFRRNTLSDLRR